MADCGAGGCLYDVFADPGEHQDLAGVPEHAAVLRDMRQRLTELRETVYQSPFSLEAPNCSAPEVAEMVANGVWAPYL